MTVVLLVIRIIGITLGAVLALAVLFILLALFCPIKYCISVNGRNSEIIAKASARWLFGLGGAKVLYKDKIISYKAGVLGMNFIKEKKEAKKEVAGEVKTEKEEEVIAEAKTEGEDVVTVDMFIRRMNEKFQRLVEKIKEIHDKVKLALYIFNAPATKRALGVCKVRIFNLLNHIKPYIIKGRITLGLSDAALCAVIYGIISSVLSTADFDRLMIMPDFENEGIVIEKFTLKGRIFVLYTLWQVLRIILNRDVSRVVRKVRRSF